MNNISLIPTRNGMAAIGQFLSCHLTYPKEASRKGITGRVFVQFTIAPDGTIHDVRTIKGIGFGCDESAEIGIAMLPDWKPGHQRGKLAPVRMILSVSFR